MFSRKIYVKVLAVAAFSLAALAGYTQIPLTFQEKKTDAVARNAIRLLNAHQADSVYALAGEVFKKQISPAIWQQVSQTQINNLLPFKEPVFKGSTNDISRYKLEGKITLTLNISLDLLDKIENFSFTAYQEEVKPSIMTDSEKKTNAVAMKVVGFLNSRQPDSSYAYAGEKFRKYMDAAAWRNFNEKQLPSLLPLANPVFINSKNGVSKYKTGQLQLTINIDATRRFEVFAIQPYQEDAFKTQKAATDNPMRSKLDSAVNRRLSAYIQTIGNVGVSAAVYYKGVDHYYNYGETAKDNHQLPTPHTLYEIGSITKTFTATLLAKAVTDGLVSLDDPITKFLPDSVAANPDLKAITLKSVANHSSGLPRMPDNINITVTDLNQPYEHYDEAHMFAFLKKFKATRAPGVTYEYSNLAVGMLGVILERIYHTPYEELVSLYIARPLKLTYTKVKLNEADAKLMAQGYNEAGKPVAIWRQASTRAAGAIRSGTADMLQYGKQQLAVMNSPLAKALNLAHQPTFDDGINKVALGWHYLYQDADPVLQHGGATGGYRAAICVNLKRDMVVVVLTNNATTGDAAGMLLMGLLEKVLPQ